MRAYFPSNPRVFRALLISAVAFGCLVAVAVLGLAYQVFWAPPGNLAREEIVKRVSRESAIYYADGKRQVGALFAGTHRQYVPLADIPPHVLKAIVASEDQNFYHHFGIDILATGKAFYEGVTHMSFRRAGSTITQQTVKIVFDDWEHSLRRKVLEAVAALKMERLYTKGQILEFYLNQFHVTSNGHGIGVAARYYFDKDAKDLDLVEAAFIAGTVKHPTKYNPFTKYTDGDRERAEENAKTRKDYVIGRMQKEGFLTEAEATAARALPVPFKRGEFRSGDVALVDLVRGQLDRPEILEALGMEDAEEFNQAGLRVITTLDADIQANAEAAVRKNLVRLELLLRGYEPESEKRFRALSDVRVGDFAYGKITEITGEKLNRAVHVSFGGPSGVIPIASLNDVAETLARASGKTPASHLQGLLAQLTPGTVVLARIVTYDPAKRTAGLDLARRPTVNGGMIVLEQGEVRAEVPGFDPHGYDRAMQAQRQPGSVFKAVTFHAALQLGWSILDPLSNIRQVFPWKGKIYVPRGDHVSPHEEASMLWAGVESENIASVWLTAHLLDRLSVDEFRAVIVRLGLAPESGETASDYQARLGRLLDVRITDDGIDERLLDVAAAELIPDAVFDGDQRLAHGLRILWWGRGYESELNKLLKMRRTGRDEAERQLRIGLVASNFVRLGMMASRARSDWTNLEAAVKKYGAATARTQATLQAMLARFAMVPGPDDTSTLAYLGDEAAATAAGTIVTRPLSDADVDRVFGGGFKAFFGLGAEIGDVQIDGWLKVGTFEKIKDLVATRAMSVRGGGDEMGISKLYEHHDFRIALALRYLVTFTRAMGVTSKVKPVLSFPLGTNAVTLAEVAKIYQTLLDGRIYRFHDGGPSNQLNLVSRIEDAHGETVYEAKKEVDQIVPADPSQPFLEIMRRVVTNGTGKMLDRELTVEEGGKSIKVPAFGKTGTTNDFTSGSFAGYLPHPKDGAQRLDPRTSYVIAAYAGFDRNEKMQRGNFKGYGSETALPAWTELAKSIVATPDYKEKLDALDLSALATGELPLTGVGGDPVRVDLLHGLETEDTQAPGTATVRSPRRSVKLFVPDAADTAKAGH